MPKNILAIVLLALIPIAGCGSNKANNNINLSAEVAQPKIKCQINTDCPVGEWCYVTEAVSYCKPNE